MKSINGRVLLEVTQQGLVEPNTFSSSMPIQTALLKGVIAKVISPSHDVMLPSGEYATSPIKAGNYVLFQKPFLHTLSTPSEKGIAYVLHAHIDVVFEDEKEAMEYMGIETPTVMYT